MRVACLFVCLLLLPVSALAGGTVGFNVTWYPTAQFLGLGEDCPITGGVVIADFNRDGIPDVAYSYSSCNELSGTGAVFAKLGAAGGKLGPDIFSYLTTETTAEMATADMNGDGWLDLVVRDPFGGCLTVVQGNGDGTFPIQHAIGCIPGYGGPSFGPYIASFTLGDFNHDGKIDVADIACDLTNAGFPSNHANCALYIHLGDGTGQSTLVQTIQLSGPSYDIQSADLNGDGNLDLVYVRSNYDSTTNTYSGVGTIRWGHGDGIFATSNATYLKPAITNPLDAVTIADFNNDGRLDVALLAGRICGPVSCALATADTVWMYTNNGGGNFTLASQTKFAQHGGTIIGADINGDLSQDLIYYNPFAMGLYPTIRPSGGFQYALGSGKATLGAQGTLPDNDIDVAAAFRDMDGDSRADYAVINWSTSQLGIGIQTGGFKNCAPPSSAKLAAKICGIKDGATVTSPVLIRASGNSPAGVNQLQVWIDGTKRYVKWGDQLAKKFTLSPGKHRIAVTANDKYIGSAKTIVNVVVP
jgi:hypothetical protein